MPVVGCSGAHLAGLQFLAPVSVIFASIAFVFSLQDRAEKNRLEAWQSIAGAKSSGSRLAPALEYLNAGSWPFANRHLLAGIDVSGTPENKTYLKRAVLSQANIARANFSNVDLSEAQLQFTYATQANFERATLGGADVSYAIFSNANLTGAWIGDIDVYETMIDPPIGGDFGVGLGQGAVLRYTNFSGADLSQVYIWGNLECASFEGANISGATIGDAGTESDPLSPTTDPRQFATAWAWSDQAPALPNIADMTLVRICDASSRRSAEPDKKPPTSCASENYDEEKAHEALSQWYAEKCWSRWSEDLYDVPF